MSSGTGTTTDAAARPAGRGLITSTANPGTTGPGRERSTMQHQDVRRAALASELPLRDDADRFLG
jgi:hypothetical protein